MLKSIDISILGVKTPIHPSEIEFREDGNTYVAYLPDKVGGSYRPDMDLEKIDAEAKIKSDLETAIQEHLDATAKSNGNWDNMMSARASAKPILATDSVEAVSMKANANALESYYFEAWAIAYVVQADIKAGTRTIPTKEEMIDELPIFS